MIQRATGRLRSASAVGLVLMLAACGSTVTQNAQTVSGSVGMQGDSTGMGPGAAAGGASARASSASHAAQTASSVGAAQGGQSQGRSSAGGVTSASSADMGGGAPVGDDGSSLVPARGPGIDSRYIYIGLTYSTDTNSANAAIG